MSSIKKSLSIVFLITVLFNPFVCLAQSVNIEGRVFTTEGPLENARVAVYKSFPDVISAKPFLTSGPTDPQGSYKIQLEGGEYYFTARGTLNGRIFYAYHGGNPIRMETGNIWLSLMATEQKEPLYSDGNSNIQGIVTYKGQPVTNAHITFYSIENSAFKGLGFLAGKGLGFVKPAEKDGTFNFTLKPNSYVIIARKLNEGRSINLLKKGELYCYYPGNPIEIKPDKSVWIEIPCYPKADRLSFVDSPKIKSNEYPTVEDLVERKDYGIKGRVTDAEGNPVANVYVIAYLVDSSSLTHESKNIAETDTHGNYFIHLEYDGSYGLVARTTLGGAPKPDDLTGLHNKNPWQGISFKAGEIIDNINITIRPASRDDIEDNKEP